MVKRPKTPETDVTGKFLIIYRAYPNSDCAAVDDKPTLVRWVAEVIHPDHIVSVWTRPQIQSLIMVEVLKDAEHAAFLGQHNWKDFLKDPRPDEMDNVSQVFYSRYSSDRGAQKEGWKLFDVHEEWFKGFRRGQGRIKQPYPETEWCDIPPVTSNVNTNIYCRPIPKAVKPPPPVVKPPVPGSQEYYGAGGLPKTPSGATGQSSSGPSSGSATPLTTEPPTPVNVIPERWPAIGTQATAKKPTPKPALGPSPAANAAQGGVGKKKGVKVGLAEFNAPKKPTGPNSWVKSVPGAAAPKPQGPIVSKDPLPSANPPKERINAWGAASAPKATTSLLTTSVSRSTSMSSQLGATTPANPNGTTKKSGWGTKSSKWGMKAKEEDAVPAWSSVKSREHSASGSVNHNADAPAGGSAHPWADYDEDDDELPEIPSFKSEPEVKEIEEVKEEVKEEYDPWAELADEAPATSATPTLTEEDDAEDTWETLGASSAQPSPGLQPQKYENTFDVDADDTPGGASWMVQGSKRGRGGANSNNFSNNRGGRGAGLGSGAGRGQGRGDARGAWAPKTGPDSRGTAWNNRGNGSRGRGGKPNGENRSQGNGSTWNKGKQKASSGEEDQWAAEARESAGNSGSSERSSPAPERVRWAPDVPPHVQGAAEGSNAGPGSSTAQGSLEVYTSTSWSHVEPIAETTEDIYADFANAPRIEFDLQSEAHTPETPSTPAEPDKRKTPKELQDEFDALFKAHQAAEKKRIEQIICPSHKVVCKKGVCKDIARIIKQENDKIEGKFNPPAHLRHLMRKGGKTRKWNTGAFRGPSRAQHEGGDAEGDERQRSGGHKAKTVGGYQTEPSHADW